MNTTTIAGSAFLLIVGIGFLGSAVVGWLHRSDETRAGLLGVAVDVLVGAVAFADAAIGVVGEPARAELWLAGTGALVLTVGLLWRHHRPPRRDRDDASTVGTARS